MTKILVSLILALICTVSSGFAINDTNANVSVNPSLLTSPYLQDIIDEIKKNTTKVDSIDYLREKAFQHAKNKEVEETVASVEKYIKTTGELEFIKQHEFKEIEGEKVYEELKASYLPRVNGWVLFFFFTSVVGIFIAVMLNFQKTNDKIANILIGLFVFFHSVLIVHFGLHASNFRYQEPHFLFLSTTFSFLYGPLLYFYFKRVALNYKFKVLDTLHLIPSVTLLLYIVPYYLLSSEEKLHLLLNTDKYLLPGGRYIVLCKAISLVTYAWLIFKISKVTNVAYSKKQEFRKWYNRISNFFSVYAISYIIYGLSILKFITFPNLNYIQGVILSSLVLYIAYTAFTKPILFLCLDIEGKGFKAVKENDEVCKYQKSGLTPDLSLELRNNLLQLLNEEKVFKVNNITLEILAERLETSRHNASQVINEHFNVNFFELINRYRIDEAKYILSQESGKSMNIIDVAYEVGYNNKVTFNKSFKKETSLTPSQYRESIKKEGLTQHSKLPDDGNANLFSGSGAA